MSVRTLLDRLLEPGGMRLKMQPLVELRPDHGTVVGVECLMRGPDGTNIEPAGVLFHYVRRKNRVVEVDRACIDNALREVVRLESLRDSSLKIHVNVHASTLERDPAFLAGLRRRAERMDLALDRLVLEIAEHEPVQADDKLSHLIGELKASGVGIAVDDIGLGAATFKTLLACCPDYLKLDRFLIHGLHRSPEQRAVLESLVLLAQRLNARVVAEGIEDPEDLEVVREFGVTLVQGFLFFPPISVQEWSGQAPVSEGGPVFEVPRVSQGVAR